jgi:hypothetical protein
VYIGGYATSPAFFCGDTKATTPEDRFKNFHPKLSYLYHKTVGCHTAEECNTDTTTQPEISDLTFGYPIRGDTKNPFLLFCC